MKYDSKVHDAINEDIVRWSWKADGAPISFAFRNDGLCGLYRFKIAGCRGCIIADDIECTKPGAPFYDWAQAITSGDLSTTIGMLKAAESPEAKRTALIMLDYLLHLEQWYVLTAEK
jgi:hypothetical protein